MKKSKTILLIIAFLTVGILNAKGYEGEYIVEGIMYDKNTKKPIPNEVFVINGNKVNTNQQGKYSIKIKWTTACPSDLNYFERKRFIRKNNPSYILFSFNMKSKRVKNKWRKYGLKFHWKETKGVYIKNLYW
ncbi:MAG: hypothetical protein P1U44_04570 [Vicingaceae bacterium]|nr:hypothetical protein [Vicingaceae bacterium]